ncbi:hypothetical protein B296_00015791, partial [Ensete ventricosum]
VLVPSSALLSQWIKPRLSANVIPCSMGLLDKLWDDTVAGPRPESGLGRLRKYSSFDFRPSSSSSPVTAAAKGTAEHTLSLSLFLSPLADPAYEIYCGVADDAATGGSGRPYGDGSSEEEAAAAPRITRSIMIKRPAGWASPPSSPAGSTSPVSPFSGTIYGFGRSPTFSVQEEAPKISLSCCECL